MTPDTRAKLVANPRVMLIETRHGGHCAFPSLDPGAAGYWAERTRSISACHGSGLTVKRSFWVAIRCLSFSLQNYDEGNAQTRVELEL
jgi:hypothetical protein